MTSDTVPVSQTLFARLATLGVDLPRTLAAAALPTALPANKRLLLSTRQYFALWEAIHEVSADPAIGLRIGDMTSGDMTSGAMTSGAMTSGATTSGAATSHEQLDIASASALHSANLGEALKKLARYKRLTCPEDIAVDIRSGEAAVTFRWLLADGFTPNLLTDAMFASTVALARRGSGQAIRPRRVELTRRVTTQPRLARHFGCDIVFDAPAVLVFDAGHLDTPFITHNENLLQALLPELDAGIAALAQEQSFPEVVDSILARGMRGQRPSVQTLARELAISSRTLQRRLAETGTTYQARLDQVRQRLARRLLGSTDLGVGEIAWFLGFEEVNSFARAFHQWEGTTPHRWRYRQEGERQPHAAPASFSV
jgi:AraC-like DNA-binding protein